MSEKEQPPAERNNGQPKDLGPKAQQNAEPKEDLAKALAEHQRAESEEPAFGWMTAGKAAKPSAVGAASPQEPKLAHSSESTVAREKAQVPAARTPQRLPEHLKTPVPTATTMLAIRPPTEEIDRRVLEREQAAQTRPVLPRVWQTLIAIFFPVVLLALAIRAIASPVFLWIEYHRPGFPADSFGFSLEDRMTFGSYPVDYLNNFADSRFLGDLVDGKGMKLFQSSEVSHMADVKGVYQISMLIGLVLLIFMAIGMRYLLRRSVGGIRRGLFAGSIATLVLIIGMGIFAILGWERFFTDFHQLLFAQGSWTFQFSDTLIRLFPEQFWTDSAGTIGVLVLLVSSLTLALSWPTKQRRQLAAKAQKPSQGRRAAA